MRVLGIEGTAWMASAAVFETTDAAFDPGTDHVFIESDAYQPDSGGIHPREAAEHMSSAVPSVVEAALEHARDRARRAGEDPTTPIDAVAFSRGPGLGPCLRIVGTAARALAGSLDVPLIGVNHMVAHLEIGRYFSGFSAPVCLNASGANAHLLGFHNGRYRVLGETMDTGVGNAIDKFTRHVGWSHPGGPKVERRAADGSYVDLPYVVKGMDFSFSGIMSAAKDAYDDGVPVEDVCFSLQENVFAVLTEVAERALSLTGSDELVLGGGVGQNDRLREMLESMCAARGAEFHAPAPRFLRDNAGMIAVLGARMYDAGDALAIPESTIDPNFRPDEVAVTWRADESVARGESATVGAREPGASPADSTPVQRTDPTTGRRIETDGREPDDERGNRRTDGRAVQGAEATVTIGEETVIKRRHAKEYRHPELDDRLRRDRTVLEARLTSQARRVGVPTPVVRDVDLEAATLTLQHVGDADLGDAPTAARARRVGEGLARIHEAGFVHGDPTTRNVRVEADTDRVFLIDFGLGYHTGHVEDHAMDLHVFKQSVLGTVVDAEPLVSALEKGYDAVGEEVVLDRLREIEGRGRYQ